MSSFVRSILLVCIALSAAACQASPTATPTAAGTPRIVTVIASALPPTSAPSETETITLTRVAKAPTIAPSNTSTLETTNTRAPSATRTASRVPPTHTRVPTTVLAPTQVLAAPTATRSPTQQPSPIPPTPEPPTAVPPTLLPTQPPAAPPAAFQGTELVTIPDGVLRMGLTNDEDGPADARPQHDVGMGSYSMERFEVTNGQYDACVRAGACSPAGERLNADNFPVVNVKWNQANAYCTWIGRRLPNEAEWERAAKGEDNWSYSWSNRPAPHFEWNAQFHGSPLSFCEASCPLPHFFDDVNDGFPTTAPVGAFSSTDPIRKDVSKGFDVADMNGNVREWVSNWYDPTAYQQGYPVDVFGPDTPTGAKVVRGSSWATEALRLATRSSLPPDQARNDIGFRCAR